MLSNTATPKYYGKFRTDVVMGKIPVNEYVSMEMNRIDALIASPDYYYDDKPVEGWIAFCEGELTLTDGSTFKMLDSYKLWGEEIFGWYYFVERTVWSPNAYGAGKGGYIKKKYKKRLTQKQYLIVGRGAAKTLYDTCIHAYFLTIDPSTTQQMTTAPTIRQSEEVLAPFRTAIARSHGDLFTFLTQGSLQNTTGDRANRQKLASTKKGIQFFVTNSYLESVPMSIDKLQGRRDKIATVDEWLSCDIREDPIGAIEQGSSKLPDYLIVATSSEGTVRNGVGDTIKMELMKILKGEYQAPHVSIWWYRLDDIEEVNNPAMWVKANPNIGKTVSYEAYQRDVERAEQAPDTRNDILAKRFGIPMEGFTYFFTYEETIPHPKQDFWNMPCALGADLSQGGDFCSFVFLFPLGGGRFGVKTINYITDFTLHKLPSALREKYQHFINEGSLVIMEGTILDIMEVYDDLELRYTTAGYDIRSFGFDPYNAKEFVNRWVVENGEFAVEKVIQGARTESVPLTELKKLAEERMIIFDQELMMFTMGNCITIQDTNGNKKLLKKKIDAKIDAVAAMMDAFISYKLNKDAFE